jgi:MFS family permease
MSAPLPGYAMLGPLRIRDFRLLWSGMTVSLLGDGVFYVAIAWQVYQLSDAPTALSLVGLTMSLSQVVFLLLGGVTSDRFDRRRVMLAADLLRAVVIGVLGLLAMADSLQLWHLVILASLYGMGAGIFGPALDAIVPDLVPDGLLAQANSLDQILRPTTLRLAGPGRVSSFDWFISIGLLPASFAATGPVAEAIGARATLIAAGLLGAVVTLGFLFLPGMRAIEHGQLPAGSSRDQASIAGVGAKGADPL